MTNTLWQQYQSAAHAQEADLQGVWMECLRAAGYELVKGGNPLHSTCHILTWLLPAEAICVPSGDQATLWTGELCSR